MDGTQKPKKFRIFDEGQDVETLYNAVYWWIDGQGRAWIRIAETNKVHQVIGDKVEIRFENAK